MKTFLLRFALLALSAATLLAATPPQPAVVRTSTWVGDGSTNYNNGNWSSSALWNPSTVPNNGGGDVFDVTIPWDPNGQVFNGPEVDINVTIRNLTLVNRVFVDSQAFPGTNLTVTGATAFTVSPDRPGEFAAIFWRGGTLLLGTLMNYDVATHTFNDAFLLPLGGATIGFHNADITKNKGTIIILGASSKLVDQDTGLNAFRNLAINEGGLTVADGYSFTTVGGLTNNGGISATTSNGATSVFTISGPLSNFNSTTKTLTGGSYNAEVTEVPGTATIRFPGADIRFLNNASIRVFGAGASIQDLTGLNALRNLTGLQGGSFNSGGLLTITPAGGTFTNNGTYHTIDSGGNLTIAGAHHSVDATTVIGPPTDSANTVLTINGHSTIEGGGLDFGGQPGVNTQYHSELHVINGIEFRGAYLTGTGTTFADVGLIQGSVFSPGHSPGQINLVGQLTVSSDSTLEFQLAGHDPGSGYDVLVQTGPQSITLGGHLHLFLLDGFETSISGTDTFEIVTSEHPILGEFDNVASGDRISTEDSLGSFIVTYAGNNTVTLSDFVPAPVLESAASQKLHGGLPYSIPLPLTPPIGVEGRNSGGSHQIVFTFNNNLVTGNVSLSAPNGGTVSGSPVFNGDTMTVYLTGVGNAQIVTLTLTGVTDEAGQILADTAVSLGFLVGDSNGDGIVNGGDAIQVRNRAGAVGPLNFRSDVNLDNLINAGDSIVTRNASGSTIYPPATNSRR